MSAAMFIGAFGAALSGFAALSLAMDRHYEDGFGRGRSPGRWRRWLQAAGVLGLGLSLTACLALQGAAQGWVLWAGVLTAAALAQVGLLTWLPRHAGTLGWAAAAAGLLAALAGHLLG